VTLVTRLKERSVIRRAGKEFRTRCPAHDDNGPSLCFELLSDGSNTLIRCAAGCEPESVVAALDMTLADLFHDDDELIEVEEDFEVASQSSTRPHRAVESHPETPARDDGPDPAPRIIEPADADLCDQVHGKLLAGLNLTDAHRQDLLRRGLSEDEIDRRGYRSLGKFEIRQALGRLKHEFDEAALLRVPGFRIHNGRLRFVDREGLLVPVRDTRGRIVALKLRADQTNNGAKYTYISSSDQGGPSPGSPPHIPLGTPAQADVVRVTEGELKADIAFARSGMPTIGVPGVDQWKSALPVLEAIGTKIVHIAIDQDARTKPGVAAALAALVKELIRLEYDVRLETWDPAGGKGVDDLLAAGKQPEVMTGQVILAKLEEISQSAAGQTADDPDEDWYPLDPVEQVASCPNKWIPALIRPFATAAARSLQCPIDFIVVAMLAVASAAIGNSRRFRIRRGYEEGARIYAAIVALAGSAKTPALRLACHPVYQQQKRHKARHKEDRLQYKADLEEFEHRRQLALKTKAPMPPGFERPTKPVMGHTYVENTTVESLAQFLSQTPRGVLMIRDELTGWVRSLNQYRSGRGADRQVFLSFWSGEPTKIDRKGELDEPLIVSDPFLSVIGCIPPKMLPTLEDDNGAEDGFLARILIVWPRSVTGRTWDWEGIKPETLKAWGDVVDRLYALEMGEDEYGDPCAKVLPLAPEACPIWEAWYNAHFAETEQPDFPDYLVGHWSKLVAYAARLALIIHLLRVACGEQLRDEVDAESLDGAF
jgi:hypothetical protein